jgi:hypothetical protein
MAYDPKAADIIGELIEVIGFVYASLQNYQHLLRQNEALEPTFRRYFALTRKASRIIGDRGRIASKLKPDPVDLLKLSSEANGLKNGFIGISGIFQYHAWSHCNIGTSPMPITSCTSGGPIQPL